MIGPLLTKWLSIKTILVIGWSGMSASLIFVVIFALAGVPVGILIAFTTLGIAWQMSGGSFFFVYVAQVTNHTQMSIANATLWLSLLLVQTLIVVDGAPIAVNFGVCAIITIIGTIYIAILMRKTEGLTLAQCK